MSRPQLVRIVVDERVPPGEFRVGGIRLLPRLTDEELGRELRTVEVRLHGEGEAVRIREQIRDSEGLQEIAPRSVSGGRDG